MVALGWKFPIKTNIQEENIRTRDTQLRVTRTEFYEIFILNRNILNILT